ncbi:MAG: hypothetical protein HZA52_18220 [Planctomycetes bacterium]|nr:hypothetical protein [Planctomycetota bacterium]
MNSQSASSSKYARLAVGLASLWILVGAGFKLLAGTPNDLPVPVRQFFADVDPGVKLHLAVAIELAVVTLGFLAPAFGWFWVSGCLAVFVAVLLKLLSMSADECGCFGTAIKVHPGLMLGIDSAMLLAIAATRPWRSLRGAKGAPLPLVLVVLALAVAAPWLVIDADGAPRRPGSGSSSTSTAIPRGATATSGPNVAPGAGATQGETPKTSETGVAAPNEPTPAVELPRYVVLSPLKQKWVGKRVGDTELGAWMDVDLYPPDSEWILFRYTCDHCREHFLKLDSEFATNPKPYVLVHIPDGNDETHKVVDTLPPHVEPIVELTRGTEWVGETPWTLELEGGVVKRAYLDDGEKEDSAKPKDDVKPADEGK